MTKFYVTLMSFVSDIEGRKRDEKGATAVEYGLLVALIAAVIIAAVLAFGDNLASIFDNVKDRVGDGTAGSAQG